MCGEDRTGPAWPVFRHFIQHLSAIVWRVEIVKVQLWKPARAHHGGSRTFGLHLRVLAWPLGLGYGVTMVDDDRK